MGFLVDGKWRTGWYDTESTGGNFIRKESTFRDFIGSKKFPAETDRYHLYISHACPWANRTMIFRALKDLEEIISVTVVDPLMAEKGWVLNEDPINNKQYMHEVYTLADPKFTGVDTVPVLWDKKLKTIVNNESSEIIRMFNSAFDGITGNTDNYYPEELQNEIDKTNEFVYETVNNGVYKAGFATSQQVYEQEVEKLFAALDILEDRLNKQRYLVGDVLTEADWRLFTTLIRFDYVYVGHFKCNLRTLQSYKNLSNYVRELYQITGVKETINFEQIKEHYYASHSTINPNGIVPVGPVIDFDAPHDRDHFN